jgi:hypothetical protein
MKPTINSIILGMIIVLIAILDSLATNLYWQHEAVTHHAARFDANSWGISSFHWNDDSAQTPFLP